MPTIRPFLCRTTLGALLLLVGAGGRLHAEPLKVVVTIAPIHSLVAAVMEGRGAPRLLVKGAASEHSYAMRPSDARLLNEADVVVRVSDRLETFLNKPLATLSGKAVVITLADVPGMKLLPPREGGAFEMHAQDHHDTHAQTRADEEDPRTATQPDSEEGEAKEYDPHLWLDPANAALIADHLAAALGKLWPDEAETYEANAARLRERLNALDAELNAKLAGLAGARFIVFHDAYQYFEERYGVRASGSLTVSPERQPGAARLQAIRAKIAEAKSACVFSEPQFEPKLVARLIEGTTAKSGTLDGLGAALPEGPEQYFTMMRNLAGSLRSCLSAG